MIFGFGFITYGGASITFPLTPSQGGTGTSTVFTQGSVVFAGASGVYTEDNANLFWDDSNNYLGIGINSELSSRLTVKGEGTTIDTYAATFMDNSSTNLMRVINNGQVRIGSLTSTANETTVRLLIRDSGLYSTAISIENTNNAGTSSIFFYSKTSSGAESYMGQLSSLAYNNNQPTLAKYVWLTATSNSFGLRFTSQGANGIEFGINSGLDMQLDASANFSVGVPRNSATSRIHVKGNSGYSQLRMETTYTPSSSADGNGNNGDFAYDSTYLYLKQGGSWKRYTGAAF